MEHGDRWVGNALRIGLLALFLWMVKTELVPVALGALFAVILEPLQRRLSPRLGRWARLAPGLLTIGVVVLGVIPLAFVAARAVVSVNEFLAHGLPGTLDALSRFATERLPGIADQLSIDVERLRAALGDVIQRAGASVAGVAGGIAGALPGQIVDVFLFMLSLFYFLRDGHKLMRFLRGLSPFPEQDTDELYQSIRDTLQGAIVGQLATSAVQGSLTLAALLIFRVPGAFLFAIIATILSVVPLVGTTPVTVGAAIYLFASGRPGAAIGMLVAALVIGVSDNVVRPFVASTRAGMHPLLTLLGIFGGLEMFGPAGLFIGPVLAALAVWIIERWAALHRLVVTRA